MTLWAGTSGFSYKEWKGSFYPEDLPASKMLEYYAERLNSVEINNTFYRLPKTSLLEGWLGKVPEDFCFVLKASQRITHHKRLKEEAADPLAYLVETTRVLGDRLGPILFQLPPYFKKNVERLRTFLAYLPEGFRAAFEFRNDTWYDDETYEALGERNAALVVADTADGSAPLIPQGTFGYARLRREQYDDDALADWAKRLKDAGWSDTFVFFKHEDEGSGPRLAQRFRDAWSAV